MGNHPKGREETDGDSRQVLDTPPKGHRGMSPDLSNDLKNSADFASFSIAKQDGDRARNLTHDSTHRSAVNDHRVQDLTHHVASVFKARQSRQLEQSNLLDAVNARLPAALYFDMQEFKSVLAAMESRNKIFLSQDQVFLV